MKNKTFKGVHRKPIQSVGLPKKGGGGGLDSLPIQGGAWQERQWVGAFLRGEG